eukprot:4904964-Lingulodinium_polyedra.AAC.1
MTTALARYPGRLCAALAELCWAARRDAGRGACGLDSWLAAWPGPGLLALVAEGAVLRALRGRPARPP